MTAVQSQADSITVHSPATGLVAGTVPIDDAETVAAKARELRLFQPEWEAIGPRGRKKWMLKWQEWILDNADHITEAMSGGGAKLARACFFSPADAGVAAALLGGSDAAVLAALLRAP